MRTVLATDEMLAIAIKEKLPGEKLIFDHASMRAKKGTIAKTILQMLDCSSSVLVIGSEKWDAIKTLLLVAPHTKAPIIWIVPETTEERLQQAVSLGVFSVIAADRTSRVSLVAAVEAQLAEHWIAGFAPRPPHPVVVVNPRDSSRARSDGSPARVLELGPRSKASANS